MMSLTTLIRQSPESGSAHRTGIHGWPLWVHTLSWGALIVLTVIIVLLAERVREQGIWSGWRESGELRGAAYAEQVFIDDVIRTRANTWSNLAYVLVGLYSLALGWHDLKRGPLSQDGYLVRTPAMSMTFGVACCYLGFGSGLFHASLTRLGQQIDVAAMYTPLVTLCAVNIGRWIPKRWQIRFPRIRIWVLLVVLVVVSGGLLFVYKWSMSSLIVLSSLIITIGLAVIGDQFQSSHRLDLRWVVVSFLMLAAAVACRELDMARRFSEPTSLLQGHAVWHVLTSLSLAAIYCYYRSEVVSHVADSSIMHVEQRLHRAEAQRAAVEDNGRTA